MKLRIVATSFLLTLGLVACGEDGPTGNVGASYLQCEGRRGGGVDRSDAVMTTIQTHAAMQDINCTDKTTFDVGGRQVTLVYVAYGMVSDCPAGCFSADLCAIYDAPNSLLYAIAGSPKPDLPGLAHPVTQTRDFQNFRDAQKANNGPWRYCFRDT